MSIVAKILEKFVAAQLEMYFETNQLLSPYQGAYCHGRSTEKILLFVTDHIVHAYKVVCSAFLDLRKAFDSLDHVLLLQRINSMEIHGTEIAWFTDYLTNRLQRVKFKGSFSSWIPVRGGIPQGRALGTLLFLVYVNDIPSMVTSCSLLMTQLKLVLEILVKKMQ